MKKAIGPLSVSEFIEYMKENPSEFTSPEYEKPMDPPWVAFPEYPRYSMGWRMGGGEDYWHEYSDWLPTLNITELKNYMTTYPEPGDWDGFYEKVTKR